MDSWVQRNSEQLTITKARFFNSFSSFLSKKKKKDAKRKKFWKRQKKYFDQLSVEYAPESLSKYTTIKDQFILALAKT